MPKKRVKVKPRPRRRVRLRQELLVWQTRGLKEGDRISCPLIRGKKTLTVKAKIVDAQDSAYLTVRFKGGEFAVGRAQVIL